MTKSHVTMEQRRCRICGKDFDTGSILLHKQLRPVFEHTTVTGMGICPEDDKMIQDGYLALIEIDPEKSHAQHNKPVQEQNAYRTGGMAWLARSALRGLLGAHPYDDLGNPLPFVFVEKGVLDKLREMVPTKETSENDPHPSV